MFQEKKMEGEWKFIFQQKKIEKERIRSFSETKEEKEVKMHMLWLSYTNLF